METSEIKQIVKENFEERYDKADYKLICVGVDENIKHLSYMVVKNKEPFVWFNVSTTSIYQATSTELLSNPYEVRDWYYFITNVEQALKEVWRRENA